MASPVLELGRHHNLALSHLCKDTVAFRCSLWCNKCRMHIHGNFIWLSKPIWYPWRLDNPEHGTPLPPCGASLLGIYEPAICNEHGDSMPWKRFLYYWPFVRGINCPSLLYMLYTINGLHGLIAFAFIKHAFLFNSVCWHLLAVTFSTDNTLIHWGRVTHKCVSKLTIIGSDNGLSPGRCQAIIWTNAGILWIRTLGTNFSEILNEIRAFSFKKMHLKMSCGKWRPFCLGLNVLKCFPSLQKTKTYYHNFFSNIHSSRNDNLIKRQSIEYKDQTSITYKCKSDYLFAFG